METSGIVVLAALLGAALLVIAVQIVTRPVVRRLAVRDALRRPGESALVVAGSLLGAAIITGSFIVGDTLESSIRSLVVDQLGPVDEMVAVPSDTSARDIYRRVAAIDDPRIDGVTILTSIQAPVAHRRGEETLAEPQAQVIELDFSDGAAFGGDPAATGIEGSTPGAGEAVVTDVLAENIEAEGGDRVEIFLYGTRLELSVERVIPARGLAGFWTGFQSTSPNIFVAPGTIDNALADAGRPARSAPPTSYVLVSNRGGVEDGVELTEEVAALVSAALPAESPLIVEKAKQEGLEHADRDGKQFSELFIGIGSFAVLAGVLLLVNIFVMLAEERKSQLGMLRAVGMKRADLVRLFVVEGALYSLVASAVGAFVGIGVGWAIVQVAAPIFGAFGDFALELRLDADSTSVVAGFLIGSLISLATVAFTSARISRINIIRAIRDLPEGPRERTRRRVLIGGAVVAVAGAALTVAAVSDNDAWAAAVLGPPLVLFGLLPAAARVVPRRAAVLGAASGSLLWGIFGNAILEDSFFGSGEIFAFVLQGVLLTLTAVVLLSHSQEGIEAAVRSVAARNLPLRLGLAYPLARRFRTGLTLGMFALVMFTMVILSVMASIFGGQVERFTRRAAGGYDIVATAAPANPPRPAQLEQVAGVEDAVAMLAVNALFQPPGYTVPEAWPAAGVGADFVANGPPALDEEKRAPGLGSAAEVWEELLANPDTMVIPSFFLQTGGGPPEDIVEPGGSILIGDPVGGTVEKRTVIGVVSEDVSFAGAIMSKQSLREVFGPRAVGARFFIVAEGSESDARATAVRLQGELLPFGLEAETFTAIVEEFGRLNLQFLRLMQGYLALGLVVGIAGLGVVMIRAVRDRRREIGVLRSLGLLSPQVRAAFMFESGFIALEGILIGSILALITSSQLIATGSFGEGLAFSVPWGQVTFLTSAAFVSALLATVWPARSASQVPPAVALRIAD